MFAWNWGFDQVCNDMQGRKQPKIDELEIKINVTEVNTFFLTKYLFARRYFHIW